jgi:hypothetical protein
MYICVVTDKTNNWYKLTQRDAFREEVQPSCRYYNREVLERMRRRKSYLLYRHRNF